MVSTEHLALLMDGAGAWNKWRAEHPNVLPDLSGCDLRQIDLTGAALNRVNLADADLQGLNLQGFNLHAVNLRYANLSGVNLDFTFVADSDLSNTCCKNASFESANLGWSNLSNTDFDGAKFAYTSFCNVDLSTAHLEKARHRGPSTVGTDTLIRTALGIRSGTQAQDVIESFLRGCGLDDRDIEGFRQHVQSPPKYRSVFICYAHHDQEFVQLLHEALASEGVRCWLDVEDMVIGAIIEDRLREAVRDHDRVVICCSEHALKHSKWVGKELDAALEKERKTGACVILPLDVDGYLQSGRSDRAREMKKRNCIDFTRWRDPSAFRMASSRLISALAWGRK